MFPLPHPLTFGILGLLAATAGLGCFIGRAAGPLLNTCPYRLSAQLSAATHILLAMAGRDSRLSMASLLVGLGATVGTFLSGHNSWLRAVSMATLGAGLGALPGSYF